jgi:hypothetical protein
MTAERGRKRETLVRKIFLPSRAETRQRRNLLKLSILHRNNKNKKTKNLYHQSQKKARRERAKAKTHKQKTKNKKKTKKSKTLFSSS